MIGKVFFVGAGPGDTGLITVKGRACIEKADVILYDRLVNFQLLHFASVSAEKVFVGKRPDHHTLSQVEINQLLVKKAREGKIVVRLKGGDPYIFGRGGEEAEECANARVPFEVIPGISSSLAVPAYAGIPLTHRDMNSSFAVITGHERPEKADTSINWSKVSTATETLIFLMGVKNLSFIVQQLVENGRSVNTPIALIRWGTLPSQQTLVGTLGDIVNKVESTGFRSPAVIVVGEVVKFREKLSWFESKPLFGKRILVTRARQQNSELLERIYELGGEGIEFPVIRIAPPSDFTELDHALQQLEVYDWVLFTSVNGVQSFFRRLTELGLDVRRMTKAQIGAIGPKTAEALREKGLHVEVLPDEYRAEALLESLRTRVKKGEHILLPRANIARKVLVEELRKGGCVVSDINTYETKIVTENVEAIISLLRKNEIDIITFTSSSTVQNFIGALALEQKEYSKLLCHTKVACIGPVTAETAQKLGVPVHSTAEEYTIEGLLKAVQKLSYHNSEKKIGRTHV